MRRHAFLFAALLVACGVLRAQWEIQDSGTSADLRGISVDGGVAWASGSNGTVLRTEDGGYLWQACAVPPGAEHLDFRGIQAFDADTAIVMSSVTEMYSHRLACVFRNVGLEDRLEHHSDGIREASCRVGHLRQESRIPPAHRARRSTDRFRVSQVTMDHTSSIRIVKAIRL